LRGIKQIPTPYYYWQEINSGFEKGLDKQWGKEVNEVWLKCYSRILNEYAKLNTPFPSQSFMAFSRVNCDSKDSEGFIVKKQSPYDRRTNCIGKK